MFSKCSFALIRSAAIELVLMSVVADGGLIVMLRAFPSLFRSSELSLMSADFLSVGESGLFGDLKPKLCDGDCCKLLDGLIVEADDTIGISDDVEVTGTCGCM